MTKETLSKAPVSRVRRTPIAVRNRLSIGERDPNYHYRIVNDIEDRVEQLISQDYEVAPATKVGDKRVDNPSSLGSAPVVSVGKGIKAVVLRKLKEWHNDDQAAKQAKIDELESSMNADAKQGK